MRSATLTLATLLAACAGPGAEAQRPFAESGVIEGFYGTPWSHQDRLDVLRFMDRVGLASYYYAPKDDPYHRSRWREPYPQQQERQLAELAATAQASGVAFVYAVSPGGSMVYSDSVDYARLMRKLHAVAALGVTRFALFLDDVPPSLEHAADRAAFQTLAEAHANLINRLHSDLAESGASLSVTPTTYTDAWGDREYLRQLGELAAPDVPFFWTGVDVAAPEITARQAREWGELIGRQPLVWDNYPVNDYARWRPFLGPVSARAADLGTAVAGILSNPMNEAHASMLPLATLAAYAHDPGAYDPALALDTALTQLYGTAGAQLVRPFVELYGDYGWDENLFEPLFIPGAPIDVAATEAGIAQLEAALAGMDSAAAGNPALAALAEDLQPFVTRTSERLRQLLSDPRYERRGGRLELRTARLRARKVAAGAIEIDGDVGEWPESGWRRLGRERGPEGRPPRFAVGHDGEHFFLALRVPETAPAPLGGDRVGEGSHLALVIAGDMETRRDFLTPEDLVVMVAAPGETRPARALTRSMPFEGFMAKFLADNRALTFSEFLLSTFGAEPAARVAEMAEDLLYAARRTESGYALELALPVGNRGQLALNLTVAAAASGRRAVHAYPTPSYPANPATFVLINLSGEPARR
jgi:hypothetical protein